MQCAYYVGLALFLALFSVAGWSHAALADIFLSTKLNDWMICLAFMGNAFVQAAALRLVVCRARKCLDFGATALFYHWLFCWIYGGLPRWSWWAWQLLCLAVTVTAGEHLCLKAELQEIPISRRLRTV